MSGGSFELPILPFFKPELEITKNDRNPEGRKEHLLQMLNKYVWTQDGEIGTAPTVVFPPLPEEAIRIGWLTRLIRVLLEVSSNNLRVGAVEDVDDAVHAETRKHLLEVQDLYCSGKNEIGGIEDVYKFVADIVRKITKPDATGVGTKLDEYKHLFQAFPLPKVATYEHFLSDELFAWYRIAGPNPMRLTKLDDYKKKFPALPDSIMQGIRLFESDSLADAQKDNRLYYIDYPEMSKIGSSQTKSNRYAYQPSAIFAVPNRGSYNQRLKPIAIKCGSDTTYPWHSASPKRTDPVTWIAAKICIQSTDGYIHELVHHLARTHLLCGIIVCATRRNLSRRHPLFELIVNHSYGTLVINFAAAKTLINDDGLVDAVTAPKAEASRNLAADSISKAEFDYNKNMPDTELKSRGVMSPSLHYPYRDDALEIWDALTKWVTSYVSAYYEDDSQVVSDVEIQNWANEISDDNKGAVGGFGDEGDGKVKSIAYLVRAVSMFIFTASVQHAAVNFPQRPFMSYAPVMPLSGYVPAPKTEKPFENFEQVIEKMMPPLKEAYSILQTAVLLGGVNYTHLGEYNDLKIEKGEIRTALKNFRETLKQIETRITARNQEEMDSNLPQYAFLRPSLVPESINI